MIPARPSSERTAKTPTRTIRAKGGWCVPCGKIPHHDSTASTGHSHWKTRPTISGGRPNQVQISRLCHDARIWRTKTAHRLLERKSARSGLLSEPLSERQRSICSLDSPLKGTTRSKILLSVFSNLAQSLHAVATSSSRASTATSIKDSSAFSCDRASQDRSRAFLPPLRGSRLSAKSCGCALPRVGQA